MLLNNLFAQGQTNSRSWVLIGPMKPLKQPEYAIGILRIKPGSIIPDADDPF